MRNRIISINSELFLDNKGRRYYLYNNLFNVQKTI